MIEHLVETDLGSVGQKMVRGDHQHEAVDAERENLEPGGLDRAGNDTESATPSAIRPTISSLSRSSRSTFTFGWAARDEASASGRNRSAHWYSTAPDLAGNPPP